MPSVQKPKEFLILQIPAREFVLAREPNNPDRQLSLANAYLAANLIDDAIPLLRAAAEKDIIGASEMLAMCYLVNGRTGKAWRELKKAAAVHRAAEQVSPLHQISLIEKQAEYCSHVGLFDSAKVYLQRAFAIAQKENLRGMQDIIYSRFGDLKQDVDRETRHLLTTLDFNL